MQEADLTAELAARLRSGDAAEPNRQDWPALVSAARDHGVLPLLAAAASRSRWDRELLEDLAPTSPRTRRSRSSTSASWFASSTLLPRPA